ncbi:MAG: hypothetical protein ACRESZ_16330 [Methylococcales bacterium]
MYSKLLQLDKNPDGLAAKVLIPILIAWTMAVHSEAVQDGDPSLSGAGNPGLLHLSEQHQKMGGIVTRMIQPTSYLPETRAFGRILSLDPLLNPAISGFTHIHIPRTFNL